MLNQKKKISWNLSAFWDKIFSNLNVFEFLWINRKWIIFQNNCEFCYNFFWVVAKVRDKLQKKKIFTTFLIRTKVKTRNIPGPMKNFPQNFSVFQAVEFFDTQKVELRKMTWHCSIFKIRFKSFWLWPKQIARTIKKHFRTGVKIFNNAGINLFLLFKNQSFPGC